MVLLGLKKQFISKLPKNSLLAGIVAFSGLFADFLANLSERFAQFDPFSEKEIKKKNWKI